MTNPGGGVGVESRSPKHGMHLRDSLDSVWRKCPGGGALCCVQRDALLWSLLASYHYSMSPVFIIWPVGLEWGAGDGSSLLQRMCSDSWKSKVAPVLTLLVPQLDWLHELELAETIELRLYVWGLETYSRLDSCFPRWGWRPSLFTYVLSLFPSKDSRNQLYSLQSCSGILGMLTKAVEMLNLGLALAQCFFLPPLLVYVH